MNDGPRNIEEALERAPEAIGQLYTWSTNYEPCCGPFTLFMDLIGYSHDEYGQNMYTGGRLGYLEAAYLGDALIYYADNPRDAQAWAELLLCLEAECEHDLRWPR